MATLRECRLSETSNRKKVNLLDYQDEIISIIEETVPGKHPRVYYDHFTTDALSKGEAIRVGQALSKNPDLAMLGKQVVTFRLFDGKNVDVPDRRPRGGRKGRR